LFLVVFAPKIPAQSQITRVNPAGGENTPTKGGWAEKGNTRKVGVTKQRKSIANPETKPKTNKDHDGWGVGHQGA